MNTISTNGIPIMKFEKEGNYGIKQIIIPETDAKSISNKLTNSCVRHSLHRNGNKITIIATLRRLSDSSVMDKVINNYYK